MNLMEAHIIGDIIGTADGGCEHCVTDLCEQLGFAFPQYKWIPKDYYTDNQRVEVDHVDQLQTAT